MNNSATQKQQVILKSLDNSILKLLQRTHFDPKGHDLKQFNALTKRAKELTG